MKSMKRLTFATKVYTNDLQTTILNKTVFTERSARSEIPTQQRKRRKENGRFLSYIHKVLYDLSDAWFR